MKTILSKSIGQTLSSEKMKLIVGGGPSFDTHCIMAGSKSDKAGSCCSGKLKDGVCQ